jgi:hypothetical protein
MLIPLETFPFKTHIFRIHPLQFLSYPNLHPANNTVTRPLSPSALVHHIESEYIPKALRKFKSTGLIIGMKWYKSIVLALIGIVAVSQGAPVPDRGGISPKPLPTPPKQPTPPRQPTPPKQPTPPQTPCPDQYPDPPDVPLRGTKAAQDSLLKC